ncbi:unnamed protein product, partial [marine sediment metagenome]
SKAIDEDGGDVEIQFENDPDRQFLVFFTQPELNLVISELVSNLRHVKAERDDNRVLVTLSTEGIADFVSLELYDNGKWPDGPQRKGLFTIANIANRFGAHFEPFSVLRDDDIRRRDGFTKKSVLSLIRFAEPQERL